MTPEPNNNQATGAEQKSAAGNTEQTATEDKEWLPSNDDIIYAGIENKEVFKDFVEWYASPLLDRARMLDIKINPETGRLEKEPTMTDFAAKYGVHRNTLTNWIKHRAFGRLVDEQRKSIGTSKVPYVLDALYRRCIKYGFANEVELYLAYYTSWHRQVKEVVEKRFDFDDLRYIITFLPKEKQKEFYKLFENMFFELRRESARQQTREPFSDLKKEGQPNTVHAQSNQPKQP